MTPPYGPFLHSGLSGSVPVRIRLQLDAGLLMLMSLVAVVMPNAEDDGAQQHARNEENELPEAVSPCPAVPEDLGQQGMKRDEEKGGGGGGKRRGECRGTGRGLPRRRPPESVAPRPRTRARRGEHRVRSSSESPCSPSTGESRGSRRQAPPASPHARP